MLNLARRQILAAPLLGLVAALAGRRAVSQAPGASLQIAIRSFAFTPDRLEVRRGQTVRWTNHDIAPHTATALDGSWDSGPLERGQTAEITFETAGTMRYHCLFHTVMTAEIIVTE